MDKNQPIQGRIAAVDFGTVRIGIALSDPQHMIASPYENYQRAGLSDDARRFQRLVAEENVTLFVVGLPVHMSGDESAKSREVRDFGEWLGEETSVPIVYFDERHTSQFAEQALRNAHLKPKSRKKRRDMLAAQMILTAYLESIASGHEHVPNARID